MCGDNDARRQFLAHVLEQYYENATSDELATYCDAVEKMAEAIGASKLTAIDNDGVDALADMLAQKIGDADFVL